MNTPTCPHCGSTHRQTKHGRTACASQRYRCHACQRLYTPVPKEQGYPQDFRHFAIKLYLEGNSLRAIARLLGVHPQTVVNWVKAYQQALEKQTPLPVPAQVETVEWDELYTFLGAKKNGWVYLVTAVDRATRCLVAFDVVLTRTFDTLQPVVDKARGAKHYYRDGLETYQTLVYATGNHAVAPGKRQTYSVEGDNADLRHYLARLHKKSRCFSRSLEALKRAVWLFAYAYNTRQLKKQAHPEYQFHLIDCLTAIS